MRGTDRINGQTGLKATWTAMRVLGAHSQRLGGWLAARLWFTPWRAGISERARAREAEWLRGTTPLSVSFEGSELRGFVAGEGPAVLLVHGWGERASTMGAFVAPLTRAGYRVAAIDLPGHGATSVSETNLFVMADALERTARDLGRVDAVIAHSMGGMAAMLGLGRGLHVQKVALIAPAVRMENALAKFNFLFDVPPKAVAGLRAHIERRFGHDIWEELSADTLAPGFSVPALIVHDEEDPQVDFADGRRLAAAWPGAEHHATTGLGHVKVVRDEKVVDKVVDFVTSEVARSSDRVGIAAGAR